MSTAIRNQDDALAWVSAHAQSLNDGTDHADQIVPVLGASPTLLSRRRIPHFQL